METIARIGRGIEKLAVYGHRLKIERAEEIEEEIQIPVP